MRPEKGSTSGTSYSICGPETVASQTLVFIHGVGLNQQIWQPQIEHFSRHYQVLVYDMLGHGDSHLPGEGATLDDYVAQLADLLESLQFDQVIVVGHSMGALVSVAFALAYPEKVIALVPMNIVYQRSTEQRKAVMARAAKVLADGEIAGVDGALSRWFADKTDPESLAKIDLVRRWMLAVDPVGYGRTYRLFSVSDDAFSGRLGQLSMPVLYLTGDNDPNSTPAMSIQMADETPSGWAASIPDEAHMMAYISPEVTNRTIEFFLKEFLE